MDIIMTIGIVLLVAGASVLMAWGVWTILKKMLLGNMIGNTKEPSRSYEETPKVIRKLKEL